MAESGEEKRKKRKLPEWALNTALITTAVGGIVGSRLTPWGRVEVPLPYPNAVASADDEPSPQEPIVPQEPDYAAAIEQAKRELKEYLLQNVSQHLRDIYRMKSFELNQYQLDAQTPATAVEYLKYYTRYDLDFNPDTGKANEEMSQKILDETWNDPEVRLVIEETFNAIKNGKCFRSRLDKYGHVLMLTSREHRDNALRKLEHVMSAGENPHGSIINLIPFKIGPLDTRCNSSEIFYEDSDPPTHRDRVKDQTGPTPER